MRHFVLPSIFVVSTFIALPAQADDAPSSADIKRAATAYDQGRERFRAEEYTEAAEKFEAADDFAPSAAALRLAIFSRKEAGQLDRALTHAALAIELYPDNSELVAEAEAVINEDSGSFGKLSVSCDEPCELLLNNRIVHGRAATNRTIFVEPGTVEIRASWSEGRNQSETVAVDAEGEESVSFYSPEIPAAAEPSEPAPDFNMSTSDSAIDEASEGGWHPAVFWTGLSLTVVGAGASVFLGLNAQNNPGADAVREKCVQGDRSCPEFKEGVQNQTYANIAIGTTAAFGVFTIASAFLTDWGGKNDDSTALRRGDLSIRPTFAVGNGASVGATGTF